jgi:dihydrolipoamide dehydrogenase
LHRGCIPAKEFLETAHVLRTIEHAGAFGFTTSTPTVDFAVSQNRKNEVVDQLHKGLSGLLKGRKIDVLEGTGRLDANNSVLVLDGADAGTTLLGKNVILASGSVPRTLPGFDVDGTIILTSDEFLALSALPTSAAVIGGGAEWGIDNWGQADWGGTMQWYPLWRQDEFAMDSFATGWTQTPTQDASRGS